MAQPLVGQYDTCHTTGYALSRLLGIVRGDNKRVSFSFQLEFARGYAPNVVVYCVDTVFHFVHKSENDCAF